MIKALQNTILLSMFSVFSICPAYALPAALNSNADTDSGYDYNVQITTDNSGTWIAVWESDDDTLSTSIGPDVDILYAISNDNGTSWTAPSPLNNNAGNDSEPDYTPQLTTNGAGTWIAVWESYDKLNDTIGSDFDADILYAISTNNGVTWSDPAPLNTNADKDVEDDYVPQIATNKSGTWIATWDSLDTLGNPNPLGSDSDILYAISTNNGADWTDPAPLNDNAASDSEDDWYSQLTTNESGVWIATWYSYDTLGNTIDSDVDILYSTSTNNGGLWSSPAPLNTNADSDSGNDFDPQITTDYLDNWIAVWSSDDKLNETIGSDLDADILYAISTNNGTTWSAPAALNSNANSDTEDDSEPQIVTDGLGTWVALWWSWEDLGNIGNDSDIVYSISVDVGATWSAPAVLNSNATSDSGEDYTPQLTTDSLGNWIATWDSDDDLATTIGTDSDIVYELWSPVSDEVWYVPDALTNGDGAELSPFNDLDSAHSALAVGGTLHVPDGLIAEEYTISKPMTIGE